jgi:hypothetical protein
MSREFDEGHILFTHAVENANRADVGGRKTDDFAAGTAELTLQGLHAIDGNMKMLLKKFAENFHECVPADGCDGRILLANFLS